MSLTAGIDLGGSYTKVVVTEPDGGIVARWVRPTGYNFAKAGRDALDACLENAGIDRDDVRYVAATGFGRYTVEIRDLAITELTCHAFAAHTLYPEARTVLDAGGQTLKAIRVDEHGRVRAFRLNDKCAAGSGAFLEKTVKYMGLVAADIPRITEEVVTPVAVSSVCAVFAESEVINHLAAGQSVGDVCGGAVIALAGRAAQLVKRVKPEPPFVLTGGMTRIRLMADELERVLGSSFAVPDDELGVYAGAFGAALLAHQRVRKLAAAQVA
ncbi:MAG TPA: acyl-CoA dehydratase activase [Acidimicrobiia bacterium]|jgi:predicted CoA-substrate-specific enzyme activase